MTEPTQQDSTTRSIKRLTVAIWVLAFVMVANFCVSLFGAFFPPFIAQRITASMPGAPFPGLSTSIREDQRFHDLPLEKQIAGASVIVLTTWKNEDGKLKCIISEILKQTPGTTFYYKVGDEYPSESLYPQENTRYGDGLVILFTGAPARMRYSSNYSNGRLGAMGDMPLALFRDMIMATNKAGSR